MRNRRSLPSFEESYERLSVSEWRLSHRGLPLIGGGLEYVVYGRNGENQIHATGATLFEAWHRAVEQAAACGMLAGWPRPALNVGGVGVRAGAECPTSPEAGRDSLALMRVPASKSVFRPC